MRTNRFHTEQWEIQLFQTNLIISEFSLWIKAQHIWQSQWRQCSDLTGTNKINQTYTTRYCERCDWTAQQATGSYETTLVPSSLHLIMKSLKVHRWTKMTPLRTLFSLLPAVIYAASGAQNLISSPESYAFHVPSDSTWPSRKCRFLFKIPSVKPL